MEKWEKDGRRESERGRGRQRESERRGAHVQFLYADGSPSSPIILASFPHSSSLLVSTWAPDTQLCPELADTAGEERSEPTME